MECSGEERLVNLLGDCIIDATRGFPRWFVIACNNAAGSVNGMRLWQKMREVVSKNVTNTGKRYRCVVHFFTKIATVVEARQVIAARPALWISCNAIASKQRWNRIMQPIRPEEKHHTLCLDTISKTSPIRWFFCFDTESIFLPKCPAAQFAGNPPACVSSFQTIKSLEVVISVIFKHFELLIYYKLVLLPNLHYDN